mgnify:CR=1 FL=1
MHQSKKRDAPTLSRVDKLKQLKTESKKYDSTPMNVPKPAMFMPANILSIDFGVYPYRNMPKLYDTNAKKKKSLRFALPPLTVKFSHLSEDGNLGKSEYTMNPKSARYTVTLERGVPGVLRAAMPALEEEQKKAFDLMDHASQEMLKFGYHSDPWTDLVGDAEEDEFLAAANYFHTHTYEDEEYKAFKLTKRLTDFQGNSQPPKFWKVNETGDYEIVEPKFIPNGSVVQCAASLRCYMIPNEKKYGVSMDLEQDIILVYVPPDEVEEEEEEETPTVIPSLPFIDFNC